jgi:glycosyltransferase involved in cell wall biosynthesis
MSQKGWFTFAPAMKHKTLGIPCFSPSYGGLEMNTLRLAQWMREGGWKVPLLLQGDSAIYKNALKDGHTATPFRGNASVLSHAKAINQWVKKNNLITLLVPFRNDLKAIAFYKLFYNRKIRIIYQQHMQVGVSKRDPLHTLRYATINAWIAPLQYLKQETIAKTRVPENKIHVIPLGLEAAAFEGGPWTRESARRALDLPQVPKMIGVLGRIDPKKGQDLVIRGIYELQQKHCLDYHLLLLGDATLNEGDAYSMQLKKLVEELGLKDRIHFRAYQPEVLQFFRAIDIFAMPSHGETYGMVTLEAMAAGVPIVGTGKDGTRELLQDGRFGYLFPKDDVAAFCSQVAAVEQNKDLPQLLQQAREEVALHYSKEEMCLKIEAVVEQLEATH